MNWQGVLKAERDEPRLWVEKVWLVESIAPLKITKTIPLRRGINLIWAQPAVGDGPLDMTKSGHGVGKSAFCQLLRYVLLDSDWSDERLREELKHKFSTGGVAARVYVLGEAWVVYMPYVHQQTRRAMQDIDLEDLFAEGAENQFELYKKSIQEGLIRDFPVKQLPADGQQIEWQHILPWCIRDQGGRFADFFRWRSGRGVHLQMRAQSPPTLVKIILGVLLDVGAHCEEAARESEIAQLKRKLEEGKRKPGFLKSHAEDALRKLTDATSDAQFSTSGLFGADQTIEALANRTLKNLEGEANRLLAKVRQFEARSISAQTQWNEKWKVHFWARYYYREQSAIFKQNVHALERLKGEWQALQAPSGDCEYGLIPFAQCDYILKRTKTPPIASAAKARTLAQEMEDAGNLLPQCRANYRAGLLELLSIRKEKQALSEERAGLLQSIIIVNTTRHRISDALTEYYRHQDILDGKAVDSGLADTERKLREAVKALNSAQTALRAQEESIRQRAKNLTETADSLAKAVFQDGEAFARFLPDSNKRLFELGPREAEAFSVLEILIADLACLLDSCRLQSHHPGLLVHDSPREAELSDATFYRLMDVLREIGSEWGDVAPFQYIVTTTNSTMRDSLRPLLCMPALGSDGPASYLFGTDLTVSRRLAESGKSPEAG